MHVIIVGAGGHAQVVADILLRCQETGEEVIPTGFVDDNPALTGTAILKLPVLGSVAQLSQHDHDAVIIAIGDNGIRRQLFCQLQQQGERFATAIHPRAIIAPDVTVGPGTMICAGVIVNTGTTIGDNVILNTGSKIDHHNHIADHCHIAPGVTMGGEVTIEEETLIGIGATIMPRCHVGANSIVGAGALVTQTVAAGQVVTGIPARPVHR